MNFSDNETLTVGVATHRERKGIIKRAYKDMQISSPSAYIEKAIKKVKKSQRNLKASGTKREARSLILSLKQVQRDAKALGW